MAGRQSLKDRIGQMTMEKPEINKKLLQINRSFLEVKKILEKK